MGAKPWIVSGLLVAIVVGLVLFLTGEPAREKSGDHRLPAAPPALTEREVQLYIEIWPQVNRRLLEVIREDRRARQAGRPYEGGMGPWLEAFLLQRQMSVADWDSLRRRVEFAVGVQRFEADRERRVRRIQADIDRKRITLRGAKDQRKELLERDIAVLEEKQRMVPRPLAPETLRLLRKYWDRLDPIVPKTK